MFRLYLVWVDASGFTRLTLVNTTGGAAGLLPSLFALSNAQYLNAVESALSVNPTPAPVAAQYPNVSDAAVLVFQDAAGNQTSLQVPAPLASTFLADQMTVDPAAVATFTAAAIGTLVTASGLPVVAFIGGVRRTTSKELYS